MKRLPFARREVAAALALILAVTGCATAASGTGPASSAVPSMPALVTNPGFPGVVVITPRPRDSDAPPPGASPTMPSWFAIPMTDVNTGKSFTIQQFAGKVILVETMATWCPTCQGEMSQVKQLIADLNNPDLIAISLDVDPNEDAGLLKKYTTQNDFTGWRVAIAPEKVTRFLTEHYDQAFMNPPLQPMLFIDREGGVYGLPTGVKSAASLRLTLELYLNP